MSQSHVQDVLPHLEEQAAERELEISNFPTHRRRDSDGDADAPRPNFESFYATGGSEGIVKM